MAAWSNGVWAALALWWGAGAPGYRAQATAEVHVVHRVCTSRHLLALTFDDGPNRTFTPQVLSLLRHYHGRATFFLVGQEALAYPDVVQGLRAAGMEIGNHGMHHRVLRGLTPEEVRAEVLDGERAIAQAGGGRTRLYRLPRGKMDCVSLRVLRELGYTVVGWSVDTQDWCTPPARHIADTILQHLAPGQIVLLHDGPRQRAHTVEALRLLLPELRRRGYALVTVSELLRARAPAATRVKAAAAAAPHGAPS